MIYVVYHGWIDGEKVAEFKTMKQAVKFIESQKEPSEYCFEKRATGPRLMWPGTVASR